MKRLASPFSGLRRRFEERAPRRVQAPGAVETAVSVILAPSKSGYDVLLIRRAERAGDPWSGHIGLPGGRREPGDADRLATAARETLEEVGVALPVDSLLGALDDLNPSVPQSPPLVISPYVFGLERRPATSLSDEVAETYWAGLDSLEERRGEAEVLIRGAKVRVPCFRPPCLGGDLVVWGLTYRILSALRPLIAAAP